MSQPTDRPAPLSFSDDVPHTHRFVDGICEYCDAESDGLDDPPEFEFDCGMDSSGNCGKAGSEECDWECPYRDVKRN